MPAITTSRTSGRAGRDEARAQRPDADPGAAGKLEVFAGAAVEIEPGVEIIGVDRLQRIAHLVEAFLVEGLRGHLRLTPVARHDVRPLGANLQLAVVGHEFRIIAQHRQADMAGAAGERIDRHEERRGLGGAEAGQHRHAIAGFPDRKFVEAVPDKGRQRGAREEHRMQPGKEFLPQGGIVAQIGQQRFIALGHVEIDRRRNLLQIAHGLLDAAGHRLALVEIHRAAIVQRQPDIVIAAEGVIPRQPVDDDRRLVLQERQRLAQHHLVGADHALGIDDRLWIAGRARRQQEFRDRVRADGLVHRVEAADATAQPSGPPARSRRGRARAPYEAAISVPKGHVGGQRIGEFRGVVGEDEARRQQLHQIAELAVVPRHQRIGRRYRTEGNAGIERAERDQCVIDRVAGENDDRPVGRKPARQQRGRDVPRRRQQFRIGDLPPAAVQRSAPP